MGARGVCVVVLLVVPVTAAVIGLAHVEAKIAIVEERTGAQGVAVFDQLLPGDYRLELDVLNGPKLVPVERS